MAEKTQETNWKQLALYFTIALLILAIGIYAILQVLRLFGYNPIPYPQTTGLTL